MKKIIAMIPARAGSKRVPKKNIRIINGKPLIQYILEATLKVGLIDEVYVNTDDEIIKNFISKEFPNVKIYDRPEALASDSATNDDFTYDFLKNVETENVIQLLATSPFVSEKQIEDFISVYLKEQCHTLVSTRKNQIECVYDSKPINFNQNLHTLPSQQLKPVLSYACSLMMWNKNMFIFNYENNLGAYHGGNGKTNYYNIDGYATVDIDNEDDFLIAEVIAEKIAKNVINTPKYYQDKTEIIRDANVTRILGQDGVITNIFENENKLKANIKNIIKSMPKNESWSYTLVNTESNRATLIAQMPGEGNRRHYHDKWDEWWYIIEGKWEFEYNNDIETIEKDNIVLIRRNNVHKITAIGNGLSIRLAVSRDDVEHIYTNEDYN